MTTTPGETPTYPRPVYANQAAANGAVIDSLARDLGMLRRRLDYDRGQYPELLVFTTGFSDAKVKRLAIILQQLDLAEVKSDGYYAKDVPNG